MFLILSIAPQENVLKNYWFDCPRFHLSINEEHLKTEWSDKGLLLSPTLANTIKYLREPARMEVYHFDSMQFFFIKKFMDGLLFLILFDKQLETDQIPNF